VAVRCRPLNRREIERGEEEVVRVINKNMLVMVEPVMDSSGNRTSKQIQFDFDMMLDKNSS
jgi:hypothetical protein